MARYDRQPTGDTAEVAFVVDDAHQSRGLGTLLLEHLAAIGRGQGLRRFVATTLPQNRRMLAVFRDAGYEVTSHFEQGTIEVSFSIGTTDASLAAQQAREHRAEAESIAGLLTPSSIALIGASRRPGTIGHEILRNLLDGGFTGPVYPVNPNARAVIGRAGVPDDRRRPRRRRPRGRRRPGNRGACSRPAMRGEGGAQPRDRLGGLCRGRRGSGAGRARSRRGRPPQRDADRGTELHGGDQHESGCAHERDLRAVRPDRRSDRLLVTIGARSGSSCSAKPRSWAWASRRSCRLATRPT